MGCLLYMLAIIGAILLLGPEVHALFGTFLTNVAVGVIIIVTFPFQVLINYRDHRESERLIEQMRDAESANDQLALISINKRLAVLEERIHKKTSVAVWTLFAIVILLVTFKLVAIF